MHKKHIIYAILFIGIVLSGIGMHQANMARNVSKIGFEAAHKHNWFWADGWFNLLMTLSPQKISDKANRLYFMFFSSFCFSVGLLFLAIIQQSHKNAQKELGDANRILYENEKALRHEKEFTESALNSQLDTFFVFDPTTGKAIRWNRAFKDITGYTNEEITEMVAPNAYYSPEDLERATSFTQKVLETEIGTIELELICKDGRKIPTEYSVSAVKDEAGNPKYFIAIGRDVTERKQSEAAQEKLKIQLMQVQKMESIGTLAGGIAHNFNNVLMGIQGRTSLLMMNKDSSHPDIEHLKGIEEYVHNAAALTNNLLGFARGGKYEVRPTNLNEFIRHENNMFAQTKKEVKVHGKYEKNIGTVEIEHSQIKHK
jgi:two-component system, cell cycle sensor histidine kinase and response regulator CckA